MAPDSASFVAFLASVYSTGGPRHPPGARRGQKTRDHPRISNMPQIHCTPKGLHVECGVASARYSKDQMTAHSFKGIASTRLNEMGCWNPDAIERQLAHQESDDVRRTYLHAAEYWPERVRMMQAWADYLDELRDAGKVVPMRRENA